MAGSSTAQSDLGRVLLGDLNVSCTITGLSGEGQLSKGDYIDFTVSTGSFSSGTT